MDALKEQVENGLVTLTVVELGKLVPKLIFLYQMKL